MQGGYEKEKEKEKDEGKKKVTRQETQAFQFMEVFRWSIVTN